MGAARPAFVIAVFLGASCSAPRSAPPIQARPSHVPLPARSAAASSSAIVKVEPPDLAARAMEAFAKERGGMHGSPTRLAYRTFKVRDAPSFLFFVGGDVAREAWVATKP